MYEPSAINVVIDGELISHTISHKFYDVPYRVTSDGAVVVGMILMIEAAGGVKNTEPVRLSSTEGKRRRFQSVVGLVLVCVFFSLLLSVFRAKTQGYPYRFVLFTFPPLMAYAIRH